MTGKDAVQLLRGSLGGSPLGAIEHRAASVHAGWILLQAWFQAVEEQRIPCTRSSGFFFEFWDPLVRGWAGAAPQQPVPCVTFKLKSPACQADGQDPGCKTWKYRRRCLSQSGGMDVGRSGLKEQCGSAPWMSNLVHGLCLGGINIGTGTWGQTPQCMVISRKFVTKWTMLPGSHTFARAHGHMP